MGQRGSVEGAMRGTLCCFLFCLQVVTLLACGYGAPLDEAQPPVADLDDAADLGAAPDVAVEDQGAPEMPSPLDLGEEELAQDLVEPDPAPDATEDVAPEDVAPEDAAPEVEDDVSPVEEQGEEEEAPAWTREDFCEEVEGFGPVFSAELGRWRAQDDAAPWPRGGLLLVGSSTARRWEEFARLYSGYGPLQRGFGGAQLGEVALRAQELVVRHDPAAVVVFAGTNDVAASVPAEVVVGRFRCLRQRIGLGLGWDRPVFFVGITPTPARWAQWPAAASVNAQIQALERDDPALRYVDVPASFLETGAPPERSLFVSDGLHLSPAGYARWEAALGPVLRSALSPRPPAPAAPLPPGARLLIDLGPNNAGDGEDSPSPDYLGQHWNNWHPRDGDAEILPGERLAGLRDSQGGATGVELVIAGGFSGNGWANGGLRWPDQAKLGALAVGSATGDFFFSDDEDRPGALFFQGLDPAQRWTLRVFASREDPQRRVTRYVVSGAQTVSGELQTSGEGAGQGRQGNDDDVLSWSGLRADAWGRLFVEVSAQEGPYGYLSLLELVAE
jgi:hypothetical protein